MIIARHSAGNRIRLMGYLNYLIPSNANPGYPSPLPSNKRKCLENAPISGPASMIDTQQTEASGRGANGATSKEHQAHERRRDSEAAGTFHPAPPVKGMAQTPKMDTWIGTDESGKGDYFGPLVIAGVCINAQIGKALASLGVKDSKKMTDKKVLELYPVIRENSLASDIVSIGPEKYNELYNKMKNLNVLLAWGHARVIENILSGIECHFALTDQFGDKSLVEKALMSRGKAIELEQRPRAEEDIAVAAASVLARGEFLLKMDSLSKREGTTLPRGASEQVVRAASALFKKKGMDGLGRVAKLHFKTTQAVLGSKKSAGESEQRG